MEVDMYLMIRQSQMWDTLTRSKTYRGIFWIFEFTEHVLCDITTLVKTIYNLLRNPSEYERCNTVYVY